MEPNNNDLTEFHWQAFQEFILNQEFQEVIKKEQDRFLGEFWPWFKSINPDIDVYDPNVRNSLMQNPEFQDGLLDFWKIFRQRDPLHINLLEQWERWKKSISLNRSDPQVIQKFQMYAKERIEPLITEQNPGGRSNNCVFVSLATILNTDAETLSKRINVAQPAPGCGFPVASIPDLLRKCGLKVSKPWIINNPATFDDWLETRDLDDVGIFLLTYERQDSAHTILVRIFQQKESSLMGWELVERQAQCGVNMEDALGSLQSGAVSWILYGPY